MQTALWPRQLSHCLGPEPFPMSLCIDHCRRPCPAPTPMSTSCIAMQAQGPKCSRRCPEEEQGRETMWEPLRPSKVQSFSKDYVWRSQPLTLLTLSFPLGGGCWGEQSPHSVLALPKCRGGRPPSSQCSLEGGIHTWTWPHSSGAHTQEVTAAKILIAEPMALYLGELGGSSRCGKGTPVPWAQDC